MGPRKTVHTTYREVKARVLGHQGLTHPHWGEKGGRGLQRGSQKGPRERERECLQTEVWEQEEKKTVLSAGSQEEKISTRSQKSKRLNKREKKSIG